MTFIGESRKKENTEAGERWLHAVLLKFHKSVGFLFRRFVIPKHRARYRFMKSRTFRLMNPISFSELRTLWIVNRISLLELGTFGKTSVSPKMYLSNNNDLLKYTPNFIKLKRKWKFFLIVSSAVSEQRQINVALSSMLYPLLLNAKQGSSNSRRLSYNFTYYFVYMHIECLLANIILLGNKYEKGFQFVLRH